MHQDFYYVYILRSVKFPGRRYIGFTTDLIHRLNEHNRGKNKSTFKYSPWKIETYIAFDSEIKAKQFERYLKTGSGRAFSKKRF